MKKSIVIFPVSGKNVTLPWPLYFSRKYWISFSTFGADSAGGSKLSKFDLNFSASSMDNMSVAVRCQFNPWS